MIGNQTFWKSSHLNDKTRNDFIQGGNNKLSTMTSVTRVNYVCDFLFVILSTSWFYQPWPDQLATKLITRKTTGLLVAVHLLFEIKIVGFFSPLSALCIFFLPLRSSSILKKKIGSPNSRMIQKMALVAKGYKYRVSPNNVSLVRFSIWCRLIRGRPILLYILNWILEFS